MKKNKRITIVCLPVAGIADPGQLLMIAGLNQHADINAKNGIHDKFFGIIRSALKFKPQFIHFDWIDAYYFRRRMIYTIPSIVLFFLQLFICRYVLRIRLCWTIHNIVPHDKKHRGLRLSVQRGVASMMQFIRVFSPASVEAVATVYRVDKKKIHFIDMGSFVGYYPDTTTRSASREFLKIAPDRKLLLTLGSVKQYKGIPEYMRTVNQLKTVNVIVMIAGKCNDALLREEIKSHCTDNILFVDQFIAADDLQYYYHAADLVIIPFLEIENSGSVVMAMGYKKPIVAPHGNVVDHRLKYQEALLYAPGGLGSVLQQALTYKPDELQQMGEANFRQLEESRWEDFGEIFHQYTFHQQHQPISR